MSDLAITLLLVGALFLILASGVWIGLTLSGVAWIGMQLFSSRPAGDAMAVTTWGSASSWTLTALPLFVWMGEILFRTRLSQDMFRGLAPWMQALPGRLLHVNVLGCGLFGAVSGSSAATCATIAKISLPELSKRGYHNGMMLGSLCGAGTLGILVPPSIAMIVYAIASDVSIIRMFIAGVLPALVLMVLFSGYIIVWALLHPDQMPAPGPRRSLGEKLRASGQLIPVLLLILFVFLSMVTGVATANEASAFGVLGALVVAGLGGSLTRQSLLDSLSGSLRMSCMIMFILGASSFLTVAMGFTGIPKALSQWVVSLGLSPYMLIAVLTVIYTILGCALDGVSMIVLTTAVVLPMVQAAGFDPIWFGVYIIIMIEVAQITPPVGFNLFVLQGMSGQGILTIARASLPFFCLMMVCVVIVVLFPPVATWLPQFVMGR